MNPHVYFSMVMGLELQTKDLDYDVKQLACVSMNKMLDCHSLAYTIRYKTIIIIAIMTTACMSIYVQRVEQTVVRAV